MEILVIDGQGGRIGQQLIKAILTRYPQVEVTAIGTNHDAGHLQAEKQRINKDNRTEPFSWLN